MNFWSKLSLCRPQYGSAMQLRVIAILLAMTMWHVPASAQPLGPVDRESFGLGISRNDPQQPWPHVPFGSWRLWDAYVTWANLESARGQWDFKTLDRLVAESESHRVRPLLVLAHSPAWASARPTEPSAYKAGVAAEPAHMDDWRTYVRAVGQRYKGRISEFQVWNEPSDKSHFTGTVAQLVALTCEARSILKGIDPAIKVVSAGSAGGGRHIKYLDDFLAAGGDRCIDVVSHHFYVPRSGPEAMVPLIREVRQVMHKRGVGKLPLWSTEVGWWIQNSDGRADDPRVANGGWRKIAVGNELAGLIQRAFLLSRAEGVDRLYWYSWTSAYGWGLENLDGSIKPGLQAWSDIYNLMLGKVVQSCVLGEANICELLDPATGRKTALRWIDNLAMSPREGAAPLASSAEAVPWRP